MKLNLCCGGKHHDGYINIDIRMGAGDIQWDCSQPLPYSSDSIDEILIEAGFEHFYRYQQLDILRDWHKKLKVGGKAKILWLPDFEVAISQYQKGEFDNMRGDCKGIDIAWGIILGAAGDEPQLHKDIFTKATILHLLKQVFNTVEVDYMCNKPESVEWPNNKYGLCVEATK